MEKYIYIITNDINSKVYIGQSNDPKHRFNQHCRPNSDNSLIDLAIQKYGKEHFTMSILEGPIKNYNEREKYYILKYNSLRPNGYNILEGGNEPPLFKGIEHPEAKFKTDTELEKIVSDLKFTKNSIRDIAKKFNVSSSCVSDINLGNTYYNSNNEYPLRKNPNPTGKLVQEDIEEIIYALKFSYSSYEDIGKRYGVEGRTISRINNGTYHKQDDISYPIRQYRATKNAGQLTYHQVSEIIELISTTKISLRQIALQYNVTPNIIIGIKNGSTKMYRRDNLIYPLRANN
jgi:group I intron endonuclease